MFLLMIDSQFLQFNLFILVVKERTKKMLLEHGIHLEDFGGDVQSVCISALKVCHSVPFHTTLNCMCQ